MLNQIVIMGRLTRDPELRKTPSGVSVASFTLACDRDFSTKGEGKHTDFIDCIAWRNTAEFLAKYFAKGRMVIVVGKLQVREYTDKNGNKRRVSEVVVDNAYFGDSKSSERAEATVAEVTTEVVEISAPVYGASAFVPYEDDEDLPF